MRRIYWLRAALGAIAGEAAQIACAFAWVAFYSHVLNPGQSMGRYEAYANQSGPLVSVIAGIPVFYAASRWIARSRPTAIALFGIFALLDGALIILSAMNAADGGTLPIGFIAASYFSKLIACYLGGLGAERTAVAAPSP